MNTVVNVGQRTGPTASNVISQPSHTSISTRTAVQQAAGAVDANEGPLPPMLPKRLLAMPQSRTGSLTCLEVSLFYSLLR